MENPFHTREHYRSNHETEIVLHGRRADRRPACTQNVDRGDRPDPLTFDAATVPNVRGGHAPFLVSLGARLFGASLDNRLAQGQSADNSRFLARRAQLIASPQWRQMLAESWLSLIEDSSDKGAPVFSARVPPVRNRIIDAEARIREVVRALVSPMPTVRGVAMASSLLSDGSGPVYYHGCTVDLDAKLREVLARLDPVGS